MNVLVLNKWGLTSLPFDQWLGPDCRLFMIANPSAASSLPADAVASMFEESFVVDDYDASPEVELLALHLAERVGLDLVVAMSETDLIRAARLRELLGITEGQSVASARAYRDKLEMKVLLRAAGVATADFRAVDDVTGLVRAGEELGYPFVLKPRRGSSSVGVELVADRKELDDVARRRLVAHDDAPAELLAEEYVEHALYHVDGLMVDGRVPYVWPSRESETLLHFGEGGANGSITLDPDDPLREPLQDLTRCALDALPGTSVTVFHAEVFEDGSGRLLLNEIAARMGGGRIKATFKLSHGVDLLEEYVRLQVMSRSERLEYSREVHRPARSAGFVLLPPRRGRVIAVPSTEPPAGVAEVRCEVAVGDVLERASSSLDAIATVTAAGSSAADVDGVLRAAQKWLEDELVVEDDGSVPR